MTMAAKLGRNELARVLSLPYDLRQASPFIAVLLSSATSSSGEAVAIAFRGNPNTRSFGQRTRGLTTANGRFTPSDGAIIILTQAIGPTGTDMAMRTACFPMSSQVRVATTPQ
jgi:hypothetical protein